MSVEKGLYYNINKRRKEGKEPKRPGQKGYPTAAAFKRLHAQPSVKVNPPPPVGHRVDPAVFKPRRVFFRDQPTYSIQSAPQRTALESRTCYLAS
jgi:hypothetical protein